LVAAAPLTTDQDGFQWYWAAGEQPENYTGGPEVSREAAMRAALREFEPGDVFTLISATKGTFWNAIPGAAEIMDLAAEKASDDGMFGDDGFDGYVGGRAAEKAAEDDLDEVLKAWFERHRAIFPTPWTFDDTRGEELVTRPPYTEVEQAEVNAIAAEIAADQARYDLARARAAIARHGVTIEPTLGAAITPTPASSTEQVAVEVSQPFRDEKPITPPSSSRGDQ
jgi:hypothetical protein